MANRNDPRDLPDTPPPKPQPKSSTSPRGGGGAGNGGGGASSADAYVLASETGTALPLVYGTARISTQLLERNPTGFTNIKLETTIPLWQSTTHYVVGDKRASNGNVYEATQEGTSYGGIDVNGVSHYLPPGTGLSGTDDDIPDGTMRWKYVAPLDTKAITAGTSFAWKPNTPYVVNAVVQSNGNLYACTVEGTSSPVGNVGYGVLGTNADIIDGTCHWMYVKGGYRNFVAIGLCEGPIVGTSRAWVGSNATISLGIPHDGNQIAFYLGTSTGIGTRPSWANYSTNDVYANTAVILAQSVGESDSSLSDVSVEVIGIFADPTTGDASPADILIDLLTHPRRGLSWSGSRIDSVSTGPGASSWRTYCTAAGLDLSWAIDAQQDALPLLDILLEVTNTDTVWTPRPDGAGGMLKFVPRADEPISGNGVTFTPNVTPVYDLTGDDFLDALQVTRAAAVDTSNSFPVEYSDRASGYRRVTVDDPDMVDVDARGLKRASTLVVPQVLAPESAVMLSRIRAQRSLNVRNRYTFQLGWRHLLLEPTDIVTLSDLALGLDRVPVRIVSIDEDQQNGSFTIVADDFPAAVHVAARYTPQVGDGFVPQLRTALNQFVLTAQQVPPGTISDAASTRGGAIDNIFPNHNSEAPPPDGADTSTAEWAGRVADAGAVSGGFVRELSVATANSREILGDQNGLNAAPAYQSQLAFAIACSPGESFYIEAQARWTVTTGTQNAGVYMYFIDANGDALTYAPAYSPLVAGQTTWTKATAVGTAPAGTVAVRFFCFADSNLGPATAQFDALYARRQIDAPIIAAGAVTADKIAAGAITADKIAAGQIKTNNYAEDGSGFPTAGVKLDTTGTALKVAPGNLLLGQTTLDQAWFAKTWMSLFVAQFGSSGSTQTASLANTFNTTSITVTGTNSFRVTFPTPPPGVSGANLVPFVIATENPQGTGLFLTQLGQGVTGTTPWVDVSVSTGTGGLPSFPVVASFKAAVLWFATTGVVF